MCCADSDEQEVIHSDYDEIDDEKDDGLWSDTEFEEEFEVPVEKVRRLAHVGESSVHLKQPR